MSLPFSLPALDGEQALRFARQALACITREYPNAPGLVVFAPDDVRSARALHPAFYGCFDWHSSVHSHWTLIHLLRLFPDLPAAPMMRDALNGNLTAEHLTAESAYLEHPRHRSFERMYGWAWLLKLAEALHDWNDSDGRNWYRNAQPLVRTVSARYREFLPRLTYPNRAGTHPNTAFGLALALDYARTVGDRGLETLLVDCSRTYFGDDADAPAVWEPSGSDFLSPSLTEADLMSRVLDRSAFGRWFDRFLPGIARGEPRRLLYPVNVSDRSDPQLGHLDGLNLSRAWCMARIALSLPGDHPARPVLLEAAGRHAAEGLAHVATGDYGGEHWLASFAVYLFAATTTANVLT